MTLSVADINHGDVLTPRRGAKRTVIGMNICGAVVERVQYEVTDRLGRSRWRSCSGETWRRTRAEAAHRAAIAKLDEASGR